MSQLNPRIAKTGKPDVDVPTPSDHAGSPSDPRIINAEELFQGRHEICLLMTNGERYRLRITRRNNLILHK